MEAIPTLLDLDPLFLGVVHLAGTPGSPRAVPMSQLLARAELDAQALLEGGCQGLIVENFGDAPFLPEAVASETIAALALAVQRVRDLAGTRPVGVNVLRNDARAALGICAATGASFLRVNLHCGAAVTDQGLLQGRAGETLRARAALAPGVLVLADVHVKHSVPLGAQPIERSARETLERGGADLLIVTGAGSGEAVQADELARVAVAVGRERVLIGSGLSLANARQLLPLARGAIVGSALKRDGQIAQPVDLERVRALARCFR